MKTKDYIDYLSANGVPTGNLLASYNFSNQVDSVILNDLYSTGDCYFKSGVNNVFHKNKDNLHIFKNGAPFSGSFTGHFTGDKYAFIQSDKQLKDFSVLLDFSYDGPSGVRSKVLFSTSTGELLSSGFVFGVNDANKFFIECGTGNLKRTKTFKKGVSKNNIIKLGVTENIFSLHKGKFNKEKNIPDFTSDLIVESGFTGKAITGSAVVNDDDAPYFYFDRLPEESSYVSSNKFFFGKPFGSYGGFSGKINQIFILENNPQTLDSHFEGFFCNGVTNVVSSGQQEFFSVENNLSYANYPILETGITGYKNVTIYDTLTDTYSSVVSGLTGVFIVGTFTSGTLLASTGFFTTTSTRASLNTGLRSSYIDLIKINFITQVESGDLFDIYDYPETNTNINLESTILDTDIALFSNGMFLVSGLDYSYSNGEIVGSFDTSDEISINRINKPTKHLLYSGLHESYRRLTGIGVGTGYYPSGAQFLESGDGNITITGLESLLYSGFSLTGNDLFMNGQKIYTGIDYETGVYGNKESVVIYASNFNDASLTITTGISGQLISIDYQTESVLSFCPRQTQSFSSSAKFLSAGLSSYDLLGKSEEIWLNGIKFIENVDYGKTQTFGSYSYNFNVTNLPYIFCKDNDNFFNID